MAPSSREMLDKQQRLRGKVTLIIDFLFIVNFMYMYCTIHSCYSKINDHWHFGTNFLNIPRIILNIEFLES